MATWATLLVQYLRHLELKGCTRASLRCMRQFLRGFQHFLEHLQVCHHDELTKAHLAAYLDHQRQRKKKNGKKASPRTAYTHIECVRRFLLHLHREEVLAEDLSQALRVRMPPKPLPRHVPSEEEMKRVVEAPDLSTPRGLRDRAALELLYGTGIRSGELRNLRLHEIDFAAKCLFVREGKGRRDRVVPLGRAAEYWVKRYLAEARPHLVSARASEGGYLFVWDHGAPLTTDTLRVLVKRYFTQCGVSGYVHAFRHAFATHLLKNGAPLLFIQRLLGHASLSSTQIYTALHPVDLIKAVREHHPRSTLPAEDFPTPIRYSEIKPSYQLRLRARGEPLGADLYHSPKLTRKLPGKKEGEDV